MDIRFQARTVTNTGYQNKFNEKKYNSTPVFKSMPNDSVSFTGKNGIIKGAALGIGLGLLLTKGNQGGNIKQTLNNGIDKIQEIIMKIDLPEIDLNLEKISDLVKSKPLSEAEQLDIINELYSDTNNTVKAAEIETTTPESNDDITDSVYESQETADNSSELTATDHSSEPQKTENVNTETTNSNKNEIPDASLEISFLKTQTYTDRNKRLYKLYETNEYNPELKEYLLSSRLDYINQNMRTDLASWINKYCKKYKVDDKLMVVSMILQESALNPTAESAAGAYGYTQLMPKTSESANTMYVNSDDPDISYDRPLDYKDPEDNVNQGISILKENLRRYRKCANPYITALAAYNAGPEAVNAFLYGKTINKGNGRVINSNGVKTPDGVPLYPETQLYTKIVVDTRDYIANHLDDLDPTIRSILELD